MTNKIRATVVFNYNGKTFKKTAYRNPDDILYTTRMFLFKYVIPASDVIEVTEH